MKKLVALPLAFASPAPPSPTRSFNFYKGRQATLIVGHGAGGGYDV